MSQSKDGNGHGEYKPKVEFERVVDDVFYRVNPETGEREDVLYAKDVIKEIEKESKKSDSDSESENP